jgi:hypothetical protein
LIEVRGSGIREPGEGLLGICGGEQAVGVLDTQRLDRDQIAS